MLIMVMVQEHISQQMHSLFRERYHTFEQAEVYLQIQEEMRIV